MHDRIDASCGEDTPAGKFLARLYTTDHSVMGLLTDKECRGRLNEGGMHELHLTAPRKDVEAFLDLVSADFGRRKGCKEFVEHVRSKMN